MSVFVFGYGSLVWRPDFAFVESHECYVYAHVRRFHQGSPDHRGTTERLGRVVTLERADDADARCQGVVFLVAAADVESVLSYLNDRESGGYTVLEVVCHFSQPILVDGVLRDSVPALAYTATRENAFYLGEATVDEIAATIAGAQGASGSNAEYLHRLHDWLAERNAADEHIQQLHRKVKELTDQRRQREQPHPHQQQLQHPLHVQHLHQHQQHQQHDTNNISSRN